MSHCLNTPGKRSAFIPIPRKSYAKKCSTYYTIWKKCTLGMLARFCSKSFKLGFSSTLTKNWMYKFDIEKAEEPDVKLPTFLGS